MPAQILFEIASDIASLVTGAESAKKSLRELRKDGVELVEQMAALSVAAAGAAAAFVAFGLQSIDAQAKLARAVDASVDGLRTLQLAADGVGVSADDLAGDLKQLNQRLGDAQRGSGAAYESLKLLGLSASDLSKLDADERVAKIADRITELGLSSQQTADLARDLGIKNENMVTLLRSGGDAIRGARKEIDEYGLSLSDVDAAKVEQANDEIARTLRVLESVRNAVTVALAPIIGELAARFNQTAKASGGFGDTATQVVEKVVRGFGFLADVINGLKVVWKGIELIAVGFAATVVTVVQGAIEVIRFFVDAVIEQINGAIDNMNALGANIDRLPKMDSSAFMQSVRKFGDEMRNTVAMVRSDMSAMAEAELPSKKIDDFLEAARARRQKMAEEAAADAEKARKDNANRDVDLYGNKELKVPSIESDIDEMLAKQDEKMKLLLEKTKDFSKQRYDGIRESLLTESELEDETYQKRSIALQAALYNGAISQKDFNDVNERLERDHSDKVLGIVSDREERIKRFKRMSFQSQAQTAIGALQDMTAGLSSQYKIAFEINKIAGIADVAIKGVQSVMNAYAWGSSIGGPYAGAAAAAVAGLFAAGQLLAIKSQSFGGGGGSAPSLAGSTPAPPVTPVTTGGGAGGQEARTGTGLLILKGINPRDMFDGETVRELAVKLSEFSRDGGRVELA